MFSLLNDDLSAGGLDCCNDFVEALVTAQIIPAGIQEEIAVCRTISRTKSWKRRDFVELLERRITLARPRVNQRQRGNSAQAGVAMYDKYFT